MQELHNFFNWLHSYLGGHDWFIILLIGTGVFFTIYLGFPQIRYFRHAIRIVSGKYDKKSDRGDATHFQALATALSGTVGTGNIAGVALAIHIGGPAALFWMLLSAFLGMCTKFVEVTLSHKYRDFDEKGQVAGGPMNYMKKRLNISTKNGKLIRTGKWLGVFFAAATILSSFGSGSLPQINSISDSVLTTFNIERWITGLFFAVILAFVIIGGIKRITKVTEKLVPSMAIIYIIGVIGVLITNYENILPSVASIFTDLFSPTAAAGGFLGAGFKYALNNGINRGLFSNEAGQGSAPIAHAAAKAHEPVSEGMVSILEPFIDTIVICMLTGVVLLSSGVWNEKLDNKFQIADMQILDRQYAESNDKDLNALYLHINNEKTLPLFNGQMKIEDGKLLNPVSIIHARSIAEDVVFKGKGGNYTGTIDVMQGKPQIGPAEVEIHGKSLLHSAPLTTVAFTRSIFGDWGKYIVTIGLMLFAFSTAISWSYYGDRSVSFLFGAKYVMFYRIVFVIAFFLASFTDTTIIWSLSLLTVVFMAIPNLISILILHKEVKLTIRDYWNMFRKENAEESKRIE